MTVKLVEGRIYRDRQKRIWYCKGPSTSDKWPWLCELLGSPIADSFGNNGTYYGSHNESEFDLQQDVTDDVLSILQPLVVKATQVAIATLAKPGENGGPIPKGPKKKKCPICRGHGGSKGCHTCKETGEVVDRAQL